MQKTNEMRDRLINEFAENYMEKLFYFCLKKTSRNVEAEDLMQDIAFQIITALNKGTIPTSFSAWVWQIARNRYSVWATEKHDQNESVTGSDVCDDEIADESENTLAEITVAIMDFSISDMNLMVFLPAHQTILPMKNQRFFMI